MANEGNTTVPTSCITFIESAHGRMRRDQRGIGKKDLQAAKKHGDRKFGYDRPNGDSTSIYTHKHIVYIMNDVNGEEVTSYALPIKLDYVPVTEEMQRVHDGAAEKIQRDNSCWNSNTVLIVDTSGSMKNSDIWGTRTRLDAVWLSIALDFIAQRLETGNGGALDIISIVSLGPTGDILFEEQPASWIFYNDIVDLYNKNIVQPRGYGDCIPSLDATERLLTRNKNASCAMALNFSSDGRPSDFYHDKCVDKYTAQEYIMKRVKSIANIFGCRNKIFVS